MIESKMCDGTVITKFKNNRIYCVLAQPIEDSEKSIKREATYGRLITI